MTDAPVHLAAIAPQFIVRDVVRTAEYYRDVLGFTIAGYFLAPPVHAIVRRDACEVFLGKAGEEAGRSNRALKSVGMDAYVRVNGLDAFCAEIRSKGARVLEGPVDRVYGMRELVVEDCNGFVLVFGEGDV